MTRPSGHDGTFQRRDEPARRSRDCRARTSRGWLLPHDGYARKTWRAWIPRGPGGRALHPHRSPTAKSSHRCTASFHGAKVARKNLPAKEFHRHAPSIRARLAPPAPRERLASGLWRNRHRGRRAHVVVVDLHPRAGRARPFVRVDPRGSTTRSRGARPSGSHREVATSLGISPGTVASVFTDARSLGLDAAAVEALSDAELEAQLYAKPRRLACAPSRTARRCTSSSSSSCGGPA